MRVRRDREGHTQNVVHTSVMITDNGNGKVKCKSDTYDRGKETDKQSGSLISAGRREGESTGPVLSALAGGRPGFLTHTHHVIAEQIAPQYWFELPKVGCVYT